MRRLFGALLACSLVLGCSALVLCACSANPTAPAGSSVQGSGSVQNTPPDVPPDISAGPQDSAPVQDTSVPDSVPDTSTATDPHVSAQDKPESPPKPSTPAPKEDPPAPSTPAPEKDPPAPSTPAPEKDPPASSTPAPEDTAPPEGSSSSTPDETPEPPKTMEEQLNELRTYIADMEGIGAHMDEYPSELGTLAVYRTPNPRTGVQYNAKFYRNDGTCIDFYSLLPACWHPYFNPRDIQFSEDGTQLTFISPIEESIDSIQLKEWGDTLCTVDLTTGEMLSMEPLNP